MRSNSHFPIYAQEHRTFVCLSVHISFLSFVNFFPFPLILYSTLFFLTYYILLNPHIPVRRTLSITFSLPCSFQFIHIFLHIAWYRSLKLLNIYLKVHTHCATCFHLIHSQECEVEHFVDTRYNMMKEMYLCGQFSLFQIFPPCSLNEKKTML